MNHNYEFKVTCDEKTITYKDYIEQEAFEIWNDKPSDYCEIKNKNYQYVQNLNGKHLIFGIVECFEQSDECPTWYNRKTAKYYWKWI